MLDQLAEIQKTADSLRVEYSAMIDAATPQEIRQRISEIDAEFSPKIKAAADNAAELEKQIKQAVLESAETSKGAALMAVWSKGRVSWDTAALDGYLKAHPELQDLRKQGEPSVSIRAIK